MFNKKVFVLLVSTVVIASLFAGSAPAGLAQSGDGEEKVLRRRLDVPVIDWSPLRGGGVHHEWYAFSWAFPFYLDTEGEIHPYLFVDWQSNDDETVWTFHLDENAVFSDGSPITADDVVGTWNLSAHPLTMHGRIGQFFSNVEGFDEVAVGDAMDMPGMVAVDEHTVEIHLKSPDPVFYQRLASQWIPVVKISQARGEDGEEVFEWWHPKNGVIVSGPYVPSKMDVDSQEFEWVPNPNFWLGEPGLDRITTVTVQDQGIAETMLLNDEIDGDVGCSSEFVGRVPGEYCEPSPSLNMHNLWLSTSIEPTNDINVRKALIMAIDRQEIDEVCFPDDIFAFQGEQLIPPVMAGHDPDWEPYPFDPEAAKEALAASSYGSAENLPKIRMVGIRDWACLEVAAQYMAESWRKYLGIEDVEFQAGMDDFSGPDQGRLQIKRDDISGQVLDPVVWLMNSIHSSSSNAQNKMDGYSNPDIDSLLEQAMVLPSTDPERIALAQEAQRLFREDWMYVPFIYINWNREMMPYVKNWVRNVDMGCIVEPWNVTIERD